MPGLGIKCLGELSVVEQTIGDHDVAFELGGYLWGWHAQRGPCAADRVFLSWSMGLIDAP
jgi:hypothetical protein